MTIITVFKVLFVVGFLIYFFRRPSIVAAIGLLTAATAVLLDTILGTFDRAALIEQLGFFFYLLTGLIAGGAAIWLAAVTRPLWGEQVLLQTTVTEIKAQPLVRRQLINQNEAHTDSPIDRQMLYDDMRTRLGYDDLFDLMYDLEIYENDMMRLPQDVNELLIRLMDYCQEHGMNHQLALAVERIITPPPPDHMPRLSKITADSPPTIIRHFLLANYRFADLQRIAEALLIDWEQLDRHNKKVFIRNLLRHVERHNQMPQLIQTMRDITEPSKQ